MRAIPVGTDGRHDLAWLRAQLPGAGLVCTMAANNETGVVSDLDGIAEVLRDGTALWLVDGVQALGKLPLRLAERGIDYVPFSGHKLYAPKGTGLLYVRDGAPFTPLQAGGGQEGALRAGTENMPGIAALGAVLRALAAGETFADGATMAAHRHLLARALEDAFPGLVFNAPPALCLPTTLNFAVPGVGSKTLLDLFDAAGLRVSGGSACGSAKAQPSDVLEAMGLPAWQAAAAVRLSFGAMERRETIDEACARIRACGAALRQECLSAVPQAGGTVPRLLTRHVVDGACCYVVTDPASRRCVVVDPLPALTERIAQWARCSGVHVAAVLDTHGHGDHASSAPELRAALPPGSIAAGPVDALGWPRGATEIALGAHRLTRLAVPGHTVDSTAYLLHEGDALRCAFVGDTVMPGALGRSDFESSAPDVYASSLLALERAVGRSTLLLPGHDYDDRFACTLATECAAQPLLAGVLARALDGRAFAEAKAALERALPLTAYRTMACGARVDACTGGPSVELSPAAAQLLLHERPAPRLVDVREAYEQRLGARPPTRAEVEVQHVPLSELVRGLPDWLALPPQTPVLFFCRSGNRSAQAARALRRLGHENAWSVAGGLALWPAGDGARHAASEAPVGRS